LGVKKRSAKKLAEGFDFCYNDSAFEEVACERSLKNRRIRLNPSDFSLVGASFPQILTSFPRVWVRN
jgi:hypothetical protein